MTRRLRGQKDPARETLPVDHEVQLAPVGDGRNHIASKPLSRAENDRGFPLEAVRGAAMVVRAHSHLVSPVNRRPCLKDSAEGTDMFDKEALPVRLQINRGAVSMPGVRAQAKKLIPDKKKMWKLSSAV